MKAVLVIDMPKACTYCPCWRAMKSYRTLDGRVFHNWCKAFFDPSSDDTGDKGMMSDDEVKKRPTWCPLRPLPKKFEPTISVASVVAGWNACIDEITGETE